jgi:CheY-like chemotaxis protein
MILVLALPDLAQKIAPLLEGTRAYVVRVTDETELRHKVYGHQPEIIILDYRMGGSKWRAVDQVPLIVERTESKPYVIAVLPYSSKRVEREAARLACYDVVVFTPRTFARELCEVVATARAARRARQAEPVRRQKLH